MQARAPTEVVLSGLVITADGGIPLYVHPGVTHLTLRDSEIRGRGDAVGIYLDAESGYNRLVGNYIHMVSSRREQLAIDGSAHNKIVGNRFSALNTGGIYLYRNCGEKDIVRHQAPQRNEIVNNVFYHAASLLGARTGFTARCQEHDANGGDCAVRGEALCL